MKFTVLGATGFIGRNLAAHLRAEGHDVDTPARGISGLGGKNAGHVIYAIGLTGDFRRYPHRTIEAHVGLLSSLMQNAEFESWLYLSSTRVYGGLAAEGTAAAEDMPVGVIPGADRLYDLSKLLGESLCLGMDNPAVRVARLSNVYGAGQSVETFLGSVMRDLAMTGRVTLQEAPDSAKDYVCIDDVVRVLADISLKGTQRLYNVASGKNTTHAQLAETLRTAGYAVDFSSGGARRVFPPVSTRRMESEFSSARHEICADLPLMVERAKAFYSGNASQGNVS